MLNRGRDNIKPKDAIKHNEPKSDQSNDDTNQHSILKTKILISHRFI